MTKRATGDESKMPPLLLIGLTAVTMLAMAANSILSRAGIADHLMDPLAFAGTRLAAGAVTLVVVVLLRGSRSVDSQSAGKDGSYADGDMLCSASTIETPATTDTTQSLSVGTPLDGLPASPAVASEIDTNRTQAEEKQKPMWRSFVPAAFLLLYLVPFSLAYLTLPSGLGALVLFGVVQITMFAGSALAGKRPSPQQWIGMCVALSGLAWILWPKEDFELDYGGVGFMILSGVGWGLFCVIGRGSKTPLDDITSSFVRCLPVAVLLMVFGDTDGYVWSVPGALTAVVAGALTSGMGYALWYFLLPFIPTAVAATTQLSVPPIAMAMGAIFLDEDVILEVALGSVVVLGGIGLSAVEYDWAACCRGSAKDGAESVPTSEPEAEAEAQPSV